MDNIENSVIYSHYLSFSRGILFLLAISISVILTTGLILISEVVYYPAYISNVLFIGGLGYTLAILFLVLGIKFKKIAKRFRNFSSFLSPILLILLLSLTFITYTGLRSTSSLVFYPREYPIEIDISYKFHTQYGDLNQTNEAFLELLFSSENMEPPTNYQNYVWGESFLQRQLVHLYNLTKDRTYLSIIFDRMDIVANHSDNNLDGVPGYGEQLQTVWVEYVVDDGMILYPMLELANIIKYGSNQTLYQEFNEKLDYYSMLGEAVIQKWTNTNWVETIDNDTGEAYGAFLSPPENIQLIYNRNSALGRLLIGLYRYTNNASYRIMIEKIARFFRSNLYVHTYGEDSK